MCCLFYFIFYIIDSPKEKNWNDLQGRTLVPNSPNHIDDEIDKCGNPLACVFVARYSKYIYVFIHSAHLHTFTFFFNIYITCSLSKRITTKELTLSLRSHFEQWGEIISINVLKDRKGRPYGFIQYEVSLVLFIWIAYRTNEYIDINCI